MTTVCEKIDFIAEAIELLASQYQESETLKGHLSILINQLSDLQDVYCQLLDERDIDTAIGVQLDILGRIIGQPRPLVPIDTFNYFGFIPNGGISNNLSYGDFDDTAIGGFYFSFGDDDGGDYVPLTDEQYRSLLRAAAFRNKIRSTPEELVQFLLFVFEDLNIPPENILITEGTQYALITIGYPLNDWEKELLKLELNDRGRGSPSYFTPRTLGVLYDFATYDPDDVFGYIDLSGNVKDHGSLGYGDVGDLLIGGTYGYII
jgi:hypothetical protein